jgi:uncharacterized protein YqjF (DUF2071 family)
VLVSRPVRELTRPGLEAPLRIHPGVMMQRWEQVSFLHWPVDPDAMRRLLPPELEVDTFDGAAWVGLIPFRLTVRLPGVPSIPWVSTFPETNVRTYVRGPDGRCGIWFLSLDAARLGGVAVARSSYRLPYVWAGMRMTSEAGLIRYRARRRWPGGGGAGMNLAIRPGASIRPEKISDLERFLIWRWRLYSPGRMKLPPRGIRLLATQVDHPPWPVRRAGIVELREDLLAAAGVEVLERDPLVHFSSGVDVRFGRREVCA